MITPVIIQIVFWFGVLACFAMGLRAIAGSFEAQPETSRSSWDARESDRFTPESERTKTKSTSTRSFSTPQFAGGLAIMLIGPLFVRLYCELLILLFKIHDELKAANDRPSRRL